MDDMRDGDVLPVGTRLEEFEIERELGAGGFGVTYLAHDTSLDRPVAIKEYLPQDWGTRRPDGGVGPRLATHAEDYRWGRERFLEEARVLARLRHPNVLQVHRVIEKRGTAYMVTEYVEGRSLEAALRAEGAWPESRVLALLDGLTAGLEPVHAAGLVHRDIKPANVMLRGDGSPVLIDFGAARQAMGRESRAITTVLTPGYAPFEQYNTKGKQGPWTDVYALGAVAYEALSGRVPEEAPERMEDDTLRPVASVAAHRVNSGFAAAIGAALALRGKDRPQTLADWRSRLGLPAAGGTADMPGGAAAGPRAQAPPAPDSGPAGPRTHQASRSRPVTYQASRPGGAFHEPAGLPAGTRLEEFEIEREMGTGGFGVTYLAHDRLLDRRVAIKEYLPHGWATRRPDGAVGPWLAAYAENYRWGLERFLEESRVLAGLHHPNVVQVPRVIEARGTAYMVMEYVEGRSLAEALRAEGPWPESRVLSLLDALTSGLGPVHAAGLAHRDIKPANVMLRGDGSPVLIDWAACQAVGLPSRSVTVPLILTPGYAPIEKYGMAGRQGPWTDVYALGAVAYEALSGRVPEEATARMEDDTLRPVAEVAAHGVSPGFAAAIGAALALRGPDRPQSLAEWRSRLGLPAA